MSHVKLVVWGLGDPTVGDGTFNATLDADIAEEDLPFVKDDLRRLMSTVWDLDVRRVHVMTEDEFDRFTSE